MLFVLHYAENGVLQVLKNIINDRAMPRTTKIINDAGAELIARVLLGLGVKRFYGLQGGHIQPIWDAMIRFGGEVVDTRDERAAVHMAHAESELTGEVGVALVTAGPGVTNAVTGVANAYKARAPVLVIGGAVPRPQTGAGALQELPQIDLMRPITRAAISVWNVQQLAHELNVAISTALGGGTPSGPVFFEVPTDVLRTRVASYLRPEDGSVVCPSQDQSLDLIKIAQAVDMLWSASRPLVITGRGARLTGNALMDLLEATGALYLDTQESRGLVSEAHSSVVSAVRGAAMREADLVVTIGRKLDYQLGYGSAAVFPHARFLRISDNVDELRDGRRGEVELLATSKRVCEAMVEIAGNRQPNTDRRWTDSLRSKHLARTGALREQMAVAEPGADGLMHPHRLLGAIRDVLHDDSILIADGGDILSFARICLPARTYLDAGVFGCLGVGVPFAIAAALVYPKRDVISVMGDGAFGFNAMELDTAFRHGARAVFIIANNGGWNIERTDQIRNYEGRIEGSELEFSNYAAMARALGLYAERIHNPGDLPAALTRAFDHAPALLDVLVTRDAISPDAASGLPFIPDLQPLKSWDDAERSRLEQS